MAQKKWTPDVTKTLVTLYEIHPVLYNNASPQYHNKVSRQSALEFIRRDLQDQHSNTTFSVEEIVKKINNLRSQFMAVRNKLTTYIPTGTGSEDFEKPAWWLYDHMQFLLPYCKADASRSNICAVTTGQNSLKGSSEDSSQDTNDIQLDETITPIEDDIIADSDTISVEEVPVVVAQSCASRTQVTQNMSAMSPRPITSRKRKLNENKYVTDAVVAAIASVTDDKQENFSTELQHFLNFVGSEMAAITDKRLRKLLQREIIQTIHTYQDMEIDNN